MSEKGNEAAFGREIGIEREPTEPLERAHLYHVATVRAGPFALETRTPKGPLS